MTWQPITPAHKDGKVWLLDNGPKARYRVCTGKWVARLNEWQSEPGGWPCRPVRIQPVPDTNDG